MVFRPSGGDHDSPNQLYLIWGADSNKSKKQPNINLNEYYFGKSQNPNLDSGGSLGEHFYDDLETVNSISSVHEFLSMIFM